MFVERIRRFQNMFLEGGFEGGVNMRSDYWKKEGSCVRIEFLHGGVRVSGSSGFYIPPEVSRWRSRGAMVLRRLYKKAVMVADQLMRLSQPHALNSLVTEDMAYDFVMSKDPCIDYDPNPFRFDSSGLNPKFKTSREVRQGWHLKKAYLADGAIFRTAYFHSLFSRHLSQTASHYLEIGAGNGNLASFFKYYNGLKTTIIDLPETILHAACFLQSHFPDSSIRLPNEMSSEEVSESLVLADFLFLTPSQVNCLPSRFFDIMVNVGSMQEMSHEQIESYFRLVQRVGKPKSLWCNSNRFEKVPRKTARPIRSTDFPYSKKNQVILDEVDRFMRLVQADAVVTRIERISIS